MSLITRTRSIITAAAVDPATDDVTRCTCSCPLETVELLGGQHPPQCRRNRIGRRRFVFGPRRHLAPWTVQPQSKHTAEYLILPWVWGPAPAGDVKPPVKLANHNYDHCCLDHIWCDVSSTGDGAAIARRWKDLQLCATALRVDGYWRWEVIDLTAEGGDRKVVADGVAGDAIDAITAAGRYVEDFEARRLEATSWTVWLLGDLRDED